MDLSEFIEKRRTAIVSEWVQQASRLAGEDHTLTEAQLSDTGTELLAALAADMQTSPANDKQVAKSRGDFNDAPSAIKDAAERHTNDRLSQGFSLDSVIAEYRALRATVFCL